MPLSVFTPVSTAVGPLGGIFVRCRKTRSAARRRGRRAPLLEPTGLGLPALLNIVRAIEAIDWLPGAGQLLRGAVNGFYFATATAAALVLALAPAVGHLLADPVHGLIGPRIQRPEESGADPSPLCPGGVGVHTRPKRLHRLRCSQAVSAAHTRRRIKM